MTLTVTRRELKRFLGKTYIDEKGCWVWCGAKNTTGYGMFSHRGRRYCAHVFAYLLYKGPIEQGLEPDHLCRNVACANPEHLEAVTHRENVLRGCSPSAINARKTHCPQGHVYDGENLQWVFRLTGKVCRVCRACKNLAERLRYARNRREQSALC